MSKFQSELHILCEKARWPEVSSILKSILEAEKLAKGECTDDSGEHGGSRSEEHQQQQQQHHHTHSPTGKDGKKSISSVAPTCVTTEPEQSANISTSSTDDSYDGGLRCS